MGQWSRVIYTLSRPKLMVRGGKKRFLGAKKNNATHRGPQLIRAAAIKHPSKVRACENK